MRTVARAAPAGVCIHSCKKRLEMKDLKHEPTCPYFAGNYMKFCIALKSTYIPSAFERTSFCTVPWHTLCNNYQQGQYSGTTEQAWQ